VLDAVAESPPPSSRAVASGRPCTATWLATSGVECRAAA
jgi:hypothetical protein